MLVDGQEEDRDETLGLWVNRDEGTLAVEDCSKAGGRKQEVDESGTSTSADPPGGESGRKGQGQEHASGLQRTSEDQGSKCVLLPGPLLFWSSSVMGGSASSWMVGTDARRPEETKHSSSGQNRRGGRSVHGPGPAHSLSPR